MLNGYFVAAYVVAVLWDVHCGQLFVLVKE